MYSKNLRISIEIIKHVMEADIDSIGPELFFYGIPKVKYRDSSFLRKLKKYRKDLDNTIFKFSQMVIPENSVVLDLVCGSYFDEKLFEYCKYTHGTVQMKLMYVLKPYLSRCKRMIEHVDYTLENEGSNYRVDEVLVEDFEFYCNAVNENSTIDDGLNIVLSLYDNDTRRSAIKFIYNLMLYNRLYDAYKDQFMFTSYFNSSIFKRLRRD